MVMEKTGVTWLSSIPILRKNYFLNFYGFCWDGISLKCWTYYTVNGNSSIHVVKNESNIEQN